MYGILKINFSFYFKGQASCIEAWPLNSANEANTWNVSTCLQFIYSIDLYALHMIQIPVLKHVSCLEIEISYV